VTRPRTCGVWFRGGRSPRAAGHPAIVSRVRAFGWRAAAAASVVAVAAFPGPSVQAAGSLTGPRHLERV